MAGRSIERRSNVDQLIGRFGNFTITLPSHFCHLFFDQFPSKNIIELFEQMIKYFMLFFALELIVSSFNTVSTSSS